MYFPIMLGEAHGAEGGVAMDPLYLVALLGLALGVWVLHRDESAAPDRSVTEDGRVSLRVLARGRGEHDPHDWRWGTVVLDADRTVWTDERGGTAPLDLTELIVTRLVRPYQGGGPTPADMLLLGHLDGRSLELAVPKENLDLLLNALPRKDLGRRARAGPQVTWMSLLRRKLGR